MWNGAFAPGFSKHRDYEHDGNVWRHLKAQGWKGEWEEE